MRALHASLAAIMLIAPGWVVACSPAARPAAPRKPVAADAGADAPAQDPSLLQAHVIAEAQDGTFGPYIAYGSKGALALYAPGGEQQRRWIAQPLSPNGSPAGESMHVGRAPGDAPVTVVRHVPATGGYLAVWVRRSDAGTALEAALLAPSGKPVAEPVVVAQASGQIVWADTAATASGTVVFWAEQRRDKASISSARIEDNGRVGQPSQVVPSARAWQVASTPSGSAIAVVRPGETPESGAGVALQLVDGWGRPSGPLLNIDSSPTASLDIDVVRLGNALVYAWTDRREHDNRVYVAASDTAGKLTAPPHPLTPPLGEQSFISLVAPRTGSEALVVYEDVSQRAPQRRAIRLTTVDAKAAVGTRTVGIEHHAGEHDLPELAASPDGYVALTHAPACVAGQPCDRSVAVPSYVRLDASLAVTSGSPLFIDKLQGGLPGAAWNPGCTDSLCMVLAAGVNAPAPVLAVPLPARKSRFVPAASLLTSAVPPHITTNEVLRSLDQQVSELSAVQIGDRHLVGWVTYFVEPPSGELPPAAQVNRAAAPGDPKKPAAANLSVLSLDAAGQPAASPTIISVRALSAGGVAMAAGAPGNKDACVAWVARDAGVPQVFVTRVSAEGKREAQQMLTRAKADASDVAVAWTGDGWAVAWVDMRDGNGEVYAAKVDRNLRKVVQDTRLTQAAGDASDVSLFARGQELFVTWSDPRDNASDGHGDPYLQKLSGANLAKLGAEVHLDHSALHARSVTLSAMGEDLIVGWLAQPLSESGAPQSLPPGPRFLRIDPKTGAPLGNLVVARATQGFNPTSFGFNCGPEMCKGVVASSPADVLRADAVVWFPPATTMQIKTITTLSGPPGEDISPNVVGEQVFFADEAAAGETRIRRARVTWVTK